MVTVYGDSPYLVGWKRIAAYLDLDVRTAQRREQDAGLPVRRYPTKGKRPEVFALRADIDRWLLKGQG